MLNKDVIERAFDLQMDLLAGEILSFAKLNIVKRNQVYTGEMFDSGRVESEFLKKAVVFDAPQSVWQEYGTPPHAIPTKGIEAIARWGTVKHGMSASDAKSMAYGYAQNVRVRGTEPRPFLRPAIDEVFTRNKLR